MAKRVILVDDLTGEALDEDKAETIAYTIDGTSYTIDLAADNARKFRAAFAQYIAVSTETRPTVAHTPVRRSTASGRRDPAQTAAIKAWGADHGFKIPQRGRLPLALVDAYNAANA